MYIDLVMVLEAILTSRQSREKLCIQYLYTEKFNVEKFQ